MPLVPDFLTRYFSKEQPKPPPISTGAAAALLVSLAPQLQPPADAHTLGRRKVLTGKTTPLGDLHVFLRDTILPVLDHAPLENAIAGCTVGDTDPHHGRATNGEALHSMGYWPVGLAETGRSLLLTAILFSGPLFETLVVEGGWRHLFSLQSMSGLFGEWIVWRNIVAGPFTEEVLFRSASVPLMLVAQTSVTQTIFLSPVIFGLAHFHHFYEFRVTHPHVPVLTGLLRSLLQFSYTSLFGAYATFLFLRTGSLLTIFIVHAFCNIMGLPRFWGRVQPLTNEGEPQVNEDRDGKKVSMKKAKAWIPWTVTYYVLLVGGAVGWWRNLSVLTESSNALVPIKM
ncbi:CaaX protease [Xylariaceae sp. FL1651]|nr:CaaX protease [Xylariaceae sp. FL1651]